MNIGYWIVYRILLQGKEILWVVTSAGSRATVRKMFSSFVDVVELKVHQVTAVKSMKTGESAVVKSSSDVRALTYCDLEVGACNNENLF